uniref:hypothetical protein n=1 Tax=Candidatus Similichlamydia epinepheli TaxID=1903953 RepID=UPI001300A417
VFLIDQREKHSCVLPIEKRPYTSWRERHQLLENILGSVVKIAAEFSFKSFVPQLSILDAGVYTLIRGFGLEVVSSEDLVSDLLEAWNQEDLRYHLLASSVLQRLSAALPQMIRSSLAKGTTLTNFSLQEDLLHAFELHECVTDVLPRVLVNEQSALPSTLFSCPIGWGDYLSCELACRHRKEGAPYAVLTRSFFLGDSPPTLLADLFLLGRKAQKVAVEFIQQRKQDRYSCLGWEVDRMVSDFLALADQELVMDSPLGFSLGKDSLMGTGPLLDDRYNHETRKVSNKIGFCMGPVLYKEGVLGINQRASFYLSSEGSLFLTTGEQTNLYTFTENREVYIPIDSDSTISF